MCGAHLAVARPLGKNLHRVGHVSALHLRSRPCNCMQAAFSHFGGQDCTSEANNIGIARRKPGGIWDTLSPVAAMGLIGTHWGFIGAYWAHWCSSGAHWGSSGAHWGLLGGSLPWIPHRTIQAPAARTCSNFSTNVPDVGAERSWRLVDSGLSKSLQLSL